MNAYKYARTETSSDSKTYVFVTAAGIPCERRKQQQCRRRSEGCDGPQSLRIYAFHPDGEGTMSHRDTKCSDRPNRGSAHAGYNASRVRVTTGTKPAAW